MKNIFKLPLLLLPASLPAQINFSGEINPNVMTRTSDQSQINLPYRLLSLDLGFTMGNWDLKTNSVIDKNGELIKDIPENEEVELNYHASRGFGRLLSMYIYILPVRLGL